MSGYLRKVIFGIICLIAIGGLFLGFRSHEGDTNNISSTRVVTDSTGREVTIPTHPKRVVLLNASHLIVGKPTSEALSDEVKEGTKNIEQIGVIHNPSVETILKLQPDLVIGVNVPFHQQLIPTLEKANIPVLIKSLDTYEDVISTLGFYGELTGEEEIAQAKIKEIEADYSFSMATSKSFTGDLLKCLGGNNIADNVDSVAKDSGYIPLGMEYIATQDPEVIFVVTHGDVDAVKNSIDENLGQNPLWQDISAVKNNRVYVLPYQLFAVNPGTNIAKAINILADDLYLQE